VNLGEGSVNVQEVQVIANKNSRERRERFPLGEGGLEIITNRRGGAVGMFTTFTKFTGPPRGMTPIIFRERLKEMNDDE